MNLKSPIRKASYRNFILAAIALMSVVIGAAIAPATDQASERSQGGTPQTVTVTEGTNIAATVSPDGSTIIMDLQGVLWSLPAAGGSAARLTEDLLEPARPHWSPRGDMVTFQSYAGGTFHIWVMLPDGSGLRQLTDGHGDDRDPRFSPDGSKIAFSSDRAFAGSYDIWVVDVASGALTRRTSDDLEEFEPSWSPDGSRIAFVSGMSSSANKIEAIDAAGARSTLATAPTGARFNAPVWSADGSKIAYVQFMSNKSQLVVSGTQVGESNDVFPFHPNWLSANEILYAGDGKLHITNTDTGATREAAFQAQFTLMRPPYERKRVDFDSRKRQKVRGIVGPALSPDNERIVFEALNQLWVMEIGKKPRQLTRDAYLKVDPAWSPDGKRIAYSSDKAGTEDIYILDLATEAEQRVTSLPGAEVSAAWSPNGNALAFQDQTGATFVIEIANGNVRQVIAPLFAPSKPSWSADGKTIALAALKPYTRRFREGTSQILTADLASGALTYTEPAPFKSISTRGEDGPMWSPDGSALAFVMETVLWVMPVDAGGRPTGPAQQINHEPTDAPTWSGDSQNLLYLSNGKLRIVSRAGSNPRTVPVDLTWRQDQPVGRTVIHAGRFWDGRGSEVLSNVDITVIGNRIAKVEPHSDKKYDDNGAGRGDKERRFIDASNLTVIPGLWESHTHQWISGKFFGDRLGRLWMTYGVTSLQSVGDPVYRAIETREAFASGERVGPRFFATGEAIDGERVYYNFMRPTTGGDEQLVRELSRAQALDYDMIKTYVRLAHAEQAKIVKFAHDEMGVWTASHYMLPGMAFGMDGTTHVSATSRLGYAYTRSAAGVSYQDMIDLYAMSGMFDISTTFNSALYAEDPAMVDDPRLLVLNPPWEQMGLRAKRDLAVSTDQTVPLDSLQKEERTLAAILQRGGTMLAGTDSPLDNPATALHLNLRAQVKFGGLAPWQALQTATLLPPQEFGVSRDLGTVEPGKLADLAFIDGNPLQNIVDLVNVRSVMKNGRLYSVEELMAPFTPAGLQHAASTHAKTINRTLEPAFRVEQYWWHDPKEWEEHAH